jgi:hypothetical protein
MVVSELECLSPWILAHWDVVLKEIDQLEEALKHMFQYDKEHVSHKN